MKSLICGVSVCLWVAASPAAAFELDALLPDDVPGYGAPFGVVDDNRLPRIDDAAGMVLGGVNISPALQLSGGYDSAPNGAAGGSAALLETPSLIVQDTTIGLGAFAASNFQQYPQAAAQNTSGFTVALGEKAVLARETVTLSAAYLDTQETGFALTTVALRRPIAFTVADVRASDAVSLGMLTVTPRVSVSNFRFSQFASQDRADFVESVTAAVAPGGPAALVMYLHATQSRYRQASFNADTNEALAGVEDDAAGLWTIRLLAGVARRQAVDTGPLTAPVFEASVDWVPGDLDRVRLSLAREIDDPDEVSAAPYTLSSAKISLAHEYLRNVTLNFAAGAANAVYLRSALRETLLNTDASADWHMSAALTLNADYAFNDRQANFLRAANEHVVTIGVTWTP